MDSKIYVLDFFGSKKIRGTGLNIPVDRFLTAYKTNSYNSFLGYFIDETNMRNSSHIEVRNSSEKYKKNQGIIWGKDPKHFDGKIEIIKSVANKVLLLTTASINIFEHSNIVWLGHQEANHWLELLSQSKFLLGMGDPLLGPSAVDAISRGCMFLNPMYDKPVIVNDQMFQSQHPYAAENIGEPYVCSYKINDILSLEKCIEKALRTTLKPYVPKHFTKEAYRQRVIDIFKL